MDQPFDSTRAGACKTRRRPQYKFQVGMTLNPVILFTREYLVTSRIPIVRRGVYVTKGGGVWSQIRAWEDGTPNRSRVSGSTKGPDCRQCGSLLTTLIGDKHTPG